MFLETFAATVNEFVINELVKLRMLEQLGPGCLPVDQSSSESDLL